jgi:hypothetical protein
MFIPAQGFRHVATLLLTNGARAIALDASPQTTHTAVIRLARELVALADDTRAPADSSAWLIAEITTLIDRLPQSFDRDAAKGDAAEVIARVASRAPDTEARDLFLIYVPEDRLPVAAPLAIELTKRRVSVAFAEYEVATAEHVTRAIDHGLAHHRGGVALRTKAFDRQQWPSLPVNDRLRIVRDAADGSTVIDLVDWVTGLRLSKS